MTLAFLHQPKALCGMGFWRWYWFSVTVVGYSRSVRNCSGCIRQSCARFLAPAGSSLKGYALLGYFFPVIVVIAAILTRPAVRVKQIIYDLHRFLIRLQKLPPRMGRGLACGIPGGEGQAWREGGRRGTASVERGRTAGKGKGEKVARGAWTRDKGQAGQGTRVKRPKWRFSVTMQHIKSHAHVQIGGGRRQRKADKKLQCNDI